MAPAYLQADNTQYSQAPGILLVGNPSAQGITQRKPILTPEIDSGVRGLKSRQRIPVRGHTL